MKLRTLQLPIPHFDASKSSPLNFITWPNLPNLSNLHHCASSKSSSWPVFNIFHHHLTDALHVYPSALKDPTAFCGLSMTHVSEAKTEICFMDSPKMYLGDDRHGSKAGWGLGLGPGLPLVFGREVIHTWQVFLSQENYAQTPVMTCENWWFRWNYTFYYPVLLSGNSRWLWRIIMFHE